MKRRLLALALTTLLVVGAVPAVSASNEVVSRMYVAERTTDGPASLVVGAGYGYGGFEGRSDGLIAIGSVREVDGEIVEADFGTIVSDGDDILPYAYAGGQRVDCGTTATCDMVIHGGGTGMAMRMDDEGGADAPTRVFVAVRGYGASAGLQSGTVGWRLRETDPTFTFSRAEDAVAVGARSNIAGGAEAFVAASGVGGDHGSVAIGQPPCSFALFTPGAGVTQLVGGATEPLHVCPAEFYGVADYASEATEWSLEGAAAGASHWHDIVRLVVIDLPPPCEDDEEACPGG